MNSLWREDRSLLDSYLLSALCISSMLLVLTSLIQFVHDKDYSLFCHRCFSFPLCTCPSFTNQVGRDFC